ncbi:MAG: lysophospholipid acyltransferase family protein [candidate division KSB1 bacterium]|nr:lysophospholipid acyltransferase family protein [candidate division KSB1 bacterium]MDZ7356001.1 lysophospholipid acyltransferase family protein [candidate division KSB1 bacterium]
MIGKLCSIRLINRAKVIALQRQHVPILYVLWHGRILIPIFVHRNEGITPMVSLHSDGEIIAQTLQRLGYRTIRGSSSRGGNKAFHEMVDILSKNGVGAIIPDGPRGPRHHLKPGTLYIAQQSQAYLVPVTFSANRKIVFNSWDRFVLPLPFAKCVMLYGEPVRVGKDFPTDQLEQIREKFEQEMISLERTADEYF